MKASAIRVVGVGLTSTLMTIRSFFPLGVNSPFGVTEYRLACRGWASAGLHPQKMIRSARFFTSPTVQLEMPTVWIACKLGAWQTEEV